MIFNTVVSGGGSKINGETKSYLATADIAKGDFVQLTTTGVEVPAFTEVATFNIGSSSDVINGAAACVLSDTQIIYTHFETASYTAANIVNVYAQAATYTGGNWVLGTKLLVYTTPTSVKWPDVNVARLTDNRAVLVYAGIARDGSSAVVILNIDINGEITVATLSENMFELYEASNQRPMKIAALTDTNFIIVTRKMVDDSSTVHYGLSAMSGVYDVATNTLTFSPPTKVVATNTTSAGYGTVLSLCVLNSNTVFCSTATGVNSAFQGYIISVTGTNISVTAYAPELGENGPCCRLSENVMAQIGCRDNDEPEYIFTYDPATGTMTAQEYMTTSVKFHTDIVRLSDDKLCAIVKSNTSISPTAGLIMNLSVIDMTAGTETVLETAVVSTGEGASNANHRMDAYAGWLTFVNGISSIIVAPCIATTTAAPYADRIDGVANNNVSAGGTAEVIVP